MRAADSSSTKPLHEPVQVYSTWMDGGHQVGETNNAGAGMSYVPEVVIADEIMKEEVLRLRARVGEFARHATVFFSS